MATKKAAAKKPGTSLIPWQERFDKSAAVGLAQVKNVGATFKSIKFGRGTINVGDDVVKSGAIECIILGSSPLKRWNKDAWDADNPKAPDCYAFPLIVDDPDAKPHPASPDKQSEDCATCEQNAFGTAKQGTGKACADTIRMGILIGKDVEDGDTALNAEMYSGSASPTNQKYYAKYVKWVAENHGNRPLWAVVTEISSHNDPKTQIRLEFKMVSIIEDDDVLLALEKRSEKVTEELTKPFSASVDKGKTPAKGSKNRKFAAKKSSKR